MKYFSLIVALLLISCQRGEEVDVLEIPSSVTHELSEVFRIVDDPDGIFFRNTINQIEFLSNDNFIIRGSRELKNIIEISNDGELVSTVGREGQGPGEFESIDRILVSPGDSLIVYDQSLARQQFFVKRDGGWQQVQALSVLRQSGQEFNSEYPLKIYQPLPNANGYRALLTNRIISSDTTSNYYYYMTDVNNNLAQTGSMENMKLVQEAAVYRSPYYGAMIDWHDRYRRSFYLLNRQNDQLIYINNWSNEIWVMDQNGDEQISGLLPFEHFLIDESVNEYIENITDVYEPERVQLIESKFPDNEPYYRNIYLDNDKLWVRFAREDESDPQWAISTISGEIEAVFRNPENFDPLTVYNGRLYGLQEVDGAPNLVSYELEN